MAGTDSGFDAEEFREAIRFAMNMGAPGFAPEAVTMQWNRRQDFAVEDPGGRTYDWGATPMVEVVIADLQLPLALEFVARPSGGRDTTVGRFDPSRVVVTLLDEEYDQMITHGSGRLPDKFLIAGSTYQVQYEEPPVGLFEVTVHRIHAEGLDER